MDTSWHFREQSQCMWLNFREKEKNKSTLKRIWKRDIHSLLGLLGKHFWPCAWGKSSAPKTCCWKNHEQFLAKDAQGSASWDKFETDKSLSISQQAELETPQIFSEGFFRSFLDVNIEMGICNPLLADMALVVAFYQRQPHCLENEVN